MTAHKHHPVKHRTAAALETLRSADTRTKLKIAYAAITVLLIVLTAFVIRDSGLTGAIISGGLAGIPLLFDK